jgi:hypothetical protein
MLVVVCLYVYSTIVARQRLGKKHYHGNKYTRNSRRIVGRVVFYAVRIVSKEKICYFFPELFVYYAFYLNVWK